MLSCLVENLSATKAARGVPLLNTIIILDCDIAIMIATVYSRLAAAKVVDIIVVLVPSEPAADAATANFGHEAMGVKHRRAGADGDKIRC